MGRPATPITLSDEERVTLTAWTRAGNTEQRYAERARMILAAAAGQPTQAIADALGTWPARVSKWRTRFAAQRLAGLLDAARPGKPRTYGPAAAQRVLAQLAQAPAAGQAGWTGEALATALGDVSVAYVRRVLRAHGIHLQRRRSWCVSTDPEFAPKAAEIVGLYLNPPRQAVVLCVDEKPHIQALERAQGWLRFTDGRALTGFRHHYKRHGATTLFAALEVATGQIHTQHARRRRRRNFLAFMNELVAAYSARELHVVLDHLNTHKPKDDRWLRDHPRVHLHFTPTYASWLTQIECWFSILSRRALRGASFTSPQQLRVAIDRFVQAYNDTATPFHWTKQAVYRKGFADSIAN